MPLRPACLVVLLLLGVPGLRAAVADERVPAIGDRDLPVTGLCAPLQPDAVTHVRLGRREEIGWYAVDGVAGPVALDGLVRVLGARAGTARPSPHAVWITATRDHAWGHVVQVRNACAAAGLYRVGVRVRSELTGEALGFPLFLPPAPSGTPGPKAGVLDVRLDTRTSDPGIDPSDPRHLYAAARRAVEKRDDFGVESIVASLWISPTASVQYALTCIDLLLRGGCAGVRLSSSARPPRLDRVVVPVLGVQGARVTPEPQSLVPPPVAPRTGPWPLLGAGRPGWVDAELVDLPGVGSARGTPDDDPQILPNYAARGEGVPGEVMARVDAEARAWARAFGPDLLAGLRDDASILPRVVVGLRREETRGALLGPAQRAFRDATGVDLFVVRFNASLFDGGHLRGRADLTLLLAGGRIEVVLGSWKAVEAAGPITLPPFPVDPYAGGEGAPLRVWLEGLFHRVRREGAGAFPLAADDAVLAGLPAVAHAGTRAAIRARGAALEVLAAWLRQTPFDRVVLGVERATASVRAGGRVVGTLDLGLRAQEGALRIDDLQPRRAP